MAQQVERRQIARAERAGPLEKLRCLLIMIERKQVKAGKIKCLEGGRGRSIGLKEWERELVAVGAKVGHSQIATSDRISRLEVERTLVKARSPHRRDPGAPLRWPGY